MTIGLAEIIAILGVASTAIGYLFRALMAEKDRTYQDMKATADQRYVEMRGDRDFWREEHEELKGPYRETLYAVRDEMVQVRAALAQLVQEREHRERRGAS